MNIFAKAIGLILKSKVLFSTQAQSVIHTNCDKPENVLLIILIKFHFIALY